MATTNSLKLFHGLLAYNARMAGMLSIIAEDNMLGTEIKNLLEDNRTYTNSLINTISED